MNVLVINCGSSSLKYQLINSDTEDVLENWFIRKPDLTKKSQNVLCLLIKKLSSSFWTL